MELQKLTIHCYAETPEEERRITLNPSKIVLLAAGTEDLQLNGRSLRRVTVLFDEGENVDVLVNHSDLELMETAVGTFYIG